MSETVTACLNCGRTDAVIPLVSLRYAGEHTWICSQCLPTLIHDPQQLAHKLAADIPPAPPHHHDHDE